MPITHDVAPPAGTDADIWVHDRTRPYRVVFGVSRGLAGRDDVLVATTAVQFEDGSLDDGSEVEPPHVFVETNRDRGLTSAQARQLAAHLLDDAANEIDGWAAR